VPEQCHGLLCNIRRGGSFRRVRGAAHPVAFFGCPRSPHIRLRINHVFTNLVEIDPIDIQTAAARLSGVSQGFDVCFKPGFLHHSKLRT